ncbi:MAG: hypothetical protein KTR27_18345 [Leptolyngbyaceae cyanobacterium MAG.088]|nr:hypothetical protein [Leptolyngbyaceae cyanobacterium MAG.088]
MNVSILFRRVLQVSCLTLGALWGQTFFFLKGHWKAQSLFYTEGNGSIPDAV